MGFTFGYNWLQYSTLLDEARVQEAEASLTRLLGDAALRDRSFIDVGAGSRAEVESFGIRPGDPIVPVGPFTVMKNEKLLMSKAFDNRFGCALAIEALRRLQGRPHPNEVYGIGNVQEEVGLRGAATTTHVVAPDIGFALDVGIAGDTPGIGPDDAAHMRCCK